MNADESYLTERLAERRRRVRSGVAGVGLLLALGLGLLLSYPTPDSLVPQPSLTTTAAQAASLADAAPTLLR